MIPGTDLIKEFEGFKSKAYQDIVGIWTIGYGTTHINDTPVVIGMTCTTEQAEEYLQDELKTIIASIDKLVKVPLNQNQFDALVSFCYNLGGHALATSTLLKKLNTGDYIGAADQFLKWDHAGGKKVPGLTRRRIAERELWIS